MKNNRIALFLAIPISLLFLLFESPVTACDIAVISAKVSSTGRPAIWKNRDNSLNWRQEVANYSKEKNKSNPQVGGSIRVISKNQGTAALSGGVNEAGFAIANTTVYQESPIRELFNANLDIMSDALETCVTIEDFHNYLLAWHENSSNSRSVVSGNFVVIDAHGGAALYELTTGTSATDMYAFGGRIKMHRIDANTGFVINEDGVLVGNAGRIGWITNYLTDTCTMVLNQDREMITDEYSLSADGSAIVDHQGRLVDTGDRFAGYVNRTNSSFWVHLADDSPREDRASDMMADLCQDGILSYRSLLQQVSRDIDIDAYGLESYEGLSDLEEGSQTQQSTYHTISRYCTTVSFVVDGVGPGDDPRLATIWVQLGEPTISVASPYFPSADYLPTEAWADSYLLGNIPLDLSGTCFLNRVIHDQRSAVYDSLNDGISLVLPPIDITSSLFIDILNINWKESTQNEPFAVFEDALINWYTAYSLYLDAVDKTDKTIDLTILKGIQDWTLPLEDTIMDNTESFLGYLRENPSYICQEDLKNFSQYCASYLYSNYAHGSADYKKWDLNYTAELHFGSFDGDIADSSIRNAQLGGPGSDLYLFLNRAASSVADQLRDSR